MGGIALGLQSLIAGLTGSGAAVGATGAGAGAGAGAAASGGVAGAAATAAPTAAAVAPSVPGLGTIGGVTASTAPVASSQGAGAAIGAGLRGLAGNALALGAPLGLSLALQPDAPDIPGPREPADEAGARARQAALRRRKAGAASNILSGGQGISGRVGKRTLGGAA